MNQPQDPTSLLDSIRQKPRLSAGALSALFLFALACLGFHGWSREGWFPVLDSANLAFHEAGHPLLGLFSARASVYGGTLFQLIFPLAAAWHFKRAGNPGGQAAALIWLGENLLNIARYMADARSQALPLVGGGMHDWTEIFSRWGVLHWDHRIAGITRALGVLLIILVMIRMYRYWRSMR